jgi:DNA-directed RNA polymerase III subunit RPC8
MLDSQVTERMYIDAAEIVRVRVESDEFYDHEPGPPPKALEGVRVAREQKKAPYTITVSQTRCLDLFFVGWCDGLFFW